MKSFKTFSLFCLAFLLASPLTRAGAAPEIPSPVNQVFQFMFSSSFTWSDGKKGNSTSYLWIPDDCVKLRGLLILANNEPKIKMAPIVTRSFKINL